MHIGFRLVESLLSGLSNQHEKLGVKNMNSILEIILLQSPNFRGGLVRNFQMPKN